MVEREQIRQEMKEAEENKFGPMKKKPKFLPALATKGILQDSSPISIGTHYVDYRDQIKNYSPDRSIEKFVGVEYKTDQKDRDPYMYGKTPGRNHSLTVPKDGDFIKSKRLEWRYGNTSGTLFKKETQ